MIPQETVAKILDSAQILEVVGDFVSLKRRGANYVACCPFHNEKTPSFYVSPSKGLFKCFGCGKSGTAVGFVMEHENLSYYEALKYLARRYNIEVREKEETAEEIAARQRTESLYLISDFAWGFFKESLKAPEGRSVGYQYFRSRGLEDATIEKYGLGWAPRSRNALREAAKAKGFKDEYLVDTGLCYRNDDGTLVDRFFDRVMFPIHSVSGRVIAFGGRTLKSGHPAMKYVNSPETEIYVKSNSLYGIYFAKHEISKQDKCYLVEGYLDVLSMHQLGITNVVASSGTSLTVPQIRMIHKFTDNVTIMYDGDSAGIHAALRGIGLILAEGMNVKVVLIPDGDDPDSYSRKHSLEEVQQFIEGNERDFIGFKTDLLLADAGNDPLKRAELINDIADTIALMPDAVKRSTYAQSSSERFKIEPSVIFDRIAQTREKAIPKRWKDPQKAQEETRTETEAEVPPEETKPALLFEAPLLEASERELLWFILNNGLSPLEFETDSELYTEEQCTVADFIRDALEADDFQFQNSLYRRTYEAYYQPYDEDESLGQWDIVMKILNGEDRQVADVAAALTQEKHQLTVKNFEAAMTALSTKLVMYVPRAILVYQSKRMQYDMAALRMRLTEVGVAEQVDILKEIQSKALLRKTIEEKLGRVQ